MYVTLLSCTEIKAPDEVAGELIRTSAKGRPRQWTGHLAGVTENACGWCVLSPHDLVSLHEGQTFPFP